MVYQQRVRVRVRIVTGCVHEPLKDQNFIPMCCVEKHRLPRCLEGGTRVLAHPPSQIEDAEATQNLHQSWYLQHQVAHRRQESEPRGPAARQSKITNQTI